MEASYRVTYLKDCLEVETALFATYEEALSDSLKVRDNTPYNVVDSLEVWKVTPIPGRVSSWELITEWASKNSL